MITSLAAFITPLAYLLYYLRYNAANAVLLNRIIVMQNLYYVFDSPLALSSRDYVSVVHHIIGFFLFYIGVMHETYHKYIVSFVFLEQGCVFPMTCILLLNYTRLKNTKLQYTLNTYNYSFCKLVLCLKLFIYIHAVSHVYVSYSHYETIISIMATSMQCKWNIQVLRKYRKRLFNAKVS